MTDLPPGPELDRLVAEKVMRWKTTTRTCLEFIGGPEYTVPGYVDHRGLFRVVDYDETERDKRFIPSNDIANAWEVVERLRALSFYATITDCGAHWDVALFNDGPIAKADTAPHAICLAALKAVRA